MTKYLIGAGHYLFTVAFLMTFNFYLIGSFVLASRCTEDTTFKTFMPLVPSLHEALNGDQACPK